MPREPAASAAAASIGQQVAPARSLRDAPSTDGATSRRHRHCIRQNAAFSSAPSPRPAGTQLKPPDPPRPRSCHPRHCIRPQTSRIAPRLASLFCLLRLLLPPRLHQSPCLSPFESWRSRPGRTDRGQAYARPRPEANWQGKSSSSSKLCSGGPGLLHPSLATTT